MQPRKSKILTTESSLLNFAAWYAMRYFPSLAKLRTALMKKSDNNEAIMANVMAEMTQYISEEKTVEGLVRMYLERGKTERYIRLKLREKQFDRVVVEAILAEYLDQISDWKTYEKTVERKIANMLEKNKSKRFIENTFSRTFSQFSSEIKILLERLCPDDTEALRAELAKLTDGHNPSDRKERERIIRKLLSRGFSYDAIRRIMQNED